MHRYFFTISARPLPPLVLGALLWFSPVRGAEYLPDAAAHLGTVFINQDDQFTTNQEVTLTLSAINPGSGLAQMQFSDDGRNWSAPETYATNKLWQLPVATEDYPPLMNTVLKTVYARVQYGNGTWSKAFSDGIVFAKSPLDVPRIKEIWIRQQRPTPYDGAQPLGSKLNPHIVAAGANQVAFDLLMNTLMSTYDQYLATPGVNQTEPQPMNNVEVLFLHIGPGTYLTHGDYGGRGGQQAWSPTSGARLQGAGKDATILKLVGGDTNYFAKVIGNAIGTGMGNYNNLEISDLTVDANMHEGGNKTSAWVRNGVTLAGNNIQLRRLRVKGFGSRIPGLEPGGLTGFNTGTNHLYNFHIEDCEVLAPQSLNKYNPLMIGYHGATLGNSLYMINVVIRNNYVNGSMYDQDRLLNPHTNSFTERGSHGITLGGCKNGIVEDNLIEHVLSGFYNDSFDVHDVLVRNNHFRDVITGMNFLTGSELPLRFEGNLVEFDPHYYTTPLAGGTSPSDYGWRRGVMLSETLRAPINQAIILSNVFQFTDRTPPTAPLNGIFADACLSGSARFESNTTFGLTRTPVKWYQWQGPPLTFLDEQADILDPLRLPPVSMAGNHHADGTVIEAYPYVLDRTLPRPVVTPGQSISFPAPLIDGLLPGMVTGLPVTNVIDGNGTFSWTPTANDIGKYVVSFYDSTSRAKDPRRTLITVQSGLSEPDPLFFMSGLKGYWRLGENTGNTFTDASGNSNNLVVPNNTISYLVLGTPGHRPGQKALYFKNTNPVKFSTFSFSSIGSLLGGFSLAYQPYLQTNTVLARPFTASYWFKADHQPTNNEVILDLGSLAFSGVAPTVPPSNNLARVFCYYGFSPDLTAYASLRPQNITVTVGEWHHQVFVYDGVSTKIYMDGNKRAEIPCGQIEEFVGSRGIFFGGGWGWNNYLGSLSDLAIWNRPLSEAEIARLHTVQKLESTFPSLTRPLPAQNMRIGY